MKQKLYGVFAVSFILSATALPMVGPSKAEEAPANGYGGNQTFDPYTPIFTPANVKLAQTTGWRYTALLVEEAVRYEPLFVQPGTQMNMGFFSGAGNLGGVVNVLDSINYKDGADTGCGKPKPGGGPTNCAIWVKGATPEEQYPQFVKNLKEHWFDRGYTPAGSPTVLIYGKKYPNINPVTPIQATQVWGHISARYTNMARAFYKATGKRVQVWALIYGANKNGIFAQYEYPELQKLEHDGVAEVHCATKLFADWKKSADWTIGTQSSACLAAVTKMRAGGEIRATTLDRAM